MTTLRHPKLVVIDGGKCPEKMRPSALKALDARIAELAAEVSRLALSALVELDAEDVHDDLADAARFLHLAQTNIAKRVRR